MNKIPCEVIRDLLPSYIDKLTSETTNQVIRTHLEECSECRAVYASMSDPEKGPEPAPQEKKEIDFLKKNKKRNRRIVLGSIAGALLLVAVVLCMRIFLIGNADETQWDAANLQVEGTSVHFNAVPTGSASAIAGLTFTEEDGVVSVSARSVLASPLHPGSYHGEYAASGEIREVRAGDRIIWSEGATVSAQASALFATRHDYIGDMPANQETANALHMSAYLGLYQNELETEQEPYGWKLLLPQEIPAAKLPQKEQDMEAFARVLIGLIGNLDHVTFEYHTGNKLRTYTVTAADATDFLGQDIKNCGENVRVLDELLTKSGLHLYASPSQPNEAEQNTLWIQIINESDLEIQSFEQNYYRDGELTSSGGGTNADNSPVLPGQSIWLSAEELQFGGSTEENQVLEIGLSFHTSAGKKIEIPDKLRVSLDPGKTCTFRLTGSEEEGYALTQ